jgi:hypothetical protein
VVINTAARNNLAVKQYGRTLDSSLEELGSQLVALWVINRQRDSLELLREFIDAVPKAAVHVVRNGYFGDEKKFELYNGSKIREEVEGRGGKSIMLPDLADRVGDDIYSRRISLKVAAKELPISEKVAETSAVIARLLAERLVGLHRVTMPLSAVVACGAPCVSAGYSMAAPVKPF